MNASKLIGAVLIIISLFAGYVGFNKVSDNTKEINLLGLKIDASNQSGREQGYMYVGFAVLLFGAGVFTMNRTKN